MFTKISVSDLRKSYDFYTKIVGLKEIEWPGLPKASIDAPSPEGAEVSLNFSGSPADPFLCLLKKSLAPTAEQVNLTVVGIKIADVRAVLNRAKAAGFSVTLEPLSIWGMVLGDVRDPDGYPIRFIEVQSVDFNPSAPSKSLRFIFITADVTSNFGLPIQKGMADAAAALGVESVFTGPQGINVPEEVARVRQAIKDRYDGIAVNVIDPDAFDAAIQEAKAAGIPVVAFNVDDHATPNARLAAVNQRFYAAGQKVGQQAKAFIPKGARVLVTVHDKGISALEERVAGMRDALADHNVAFTVIVSGSTVAASENTIAQALKTHPDIHYILATGQADTEAAGRVLEKHYRNSAYAAAGFDISPAILDLVESGALKFTTDQQPYLQGFYPVVQLTLYKRYGIAPTDIDTGAALITRAEVPQIRRLSEQHYR